MGSRGNRHGEDIKGLLAQGSFHIEFDGGDWRVESGKVIIVESGVWGKGNLRVEFDSENQWRGDVFS